MSELSFEQMLEESFKTIHNGEVVEGTVIDVKPDEIILNIGYKADGIITKSEYSNDQSLDLTTVVSVGDTMTVKVNGIHDLTLYNDCIVIFIYAIVCTIYIRTTRFNNQITASLCNIYIL